MPSGALLFEARLVSCRQCLVLLYMLCWLLKPLSSSQLPSACSQKKKNNTQGEELCRREERAWGEPSPRLAERSVWARYGTRLGWLPAEMLGSYTS